jgi:hypothetical protein
MILSFYNFNKIINNYVNEIYLIPLIYKYYNDTKQRLNDEFNKTFIRLSPYILFWINNGEPNKKVVYKQIESLPRYNLTLVRITKYKNRHIEHENIHITETFKSKNNLIPITYIK